MIFPKKETPIEEIDYESQISNLINQNNEIPAILLAHTYIEGLLTQWFLTLGPTYRHKTELIQRIEKIGSGNMLTIHLLLGNIDYKLYSKIKTLSEYRNDIAHKYVIIDSSAKNKAKKVAKESVEICSETFESFKKYLDNKSRTLLENSQ